MRHRAVLASEQRTPHKMTMIRRTVKGYAPPKLLEYSPFYSRPGLVCGGIFTRCSRRHPSLQEGWGVALAEHGNPPPPSLPPLEETPQQTSCWDLLPPIASSLLATIRGGGEENTNRGINCLPPPLTSSSCPVQWQCCSIIRQLFIPHQSPPAFLFSPHFGQKSGSNGFLAERI